MNHFRKPNSQAQAQGIPLEISSSDENSKDNIGFTYSSFNPSAFLIPEWKGEGLISPSAIVIKNSLNALSLDSITLFKKSSSSNKTMRLQAYNEFIQFADYAKIDKNFALLQNDFWLHMEDQNSPYSKHLEDFVRIHCFRAVAIYLFRIKFLLDFSKEKKLDITEDVLLNPLSFLGKIFKKDSSTELFSESLKINEFSWYRPSTLHKESIFKLREAFENITLTELIKLISTPKDDKIYSNRNYSHSLSHLSLGLFINELLVKFPTWLKSEGKKKSSALKKPKSMPDIINTRFTGNHVSSLALSHWLAQESSIKLSQWDNLICPEFEGLEFIDGQFLKICQELQFLSFLTKVAVEHNYEIVQFICTVMREKNFNSNKEEINHQASFLNLTEAARPEVLFSRIVLNLTESPKTNPHHFLIQQIQAQKPVLKKDGMVFVFTNQNLFVPSQSDRVEQLLKEFKVEACLNLEELKGKGEIAHYIYILTKRTIQTSAHKHLFESNKKIKESCLSFEVKGNLSRFNKFNKLVDELQSFMQLKNPVTTPLYFSEPEKNISFEFHQDAIIEGKLLSSVSTKENGHLPHPSFFKNLTRSCTSLENYFHIELISQDENFNAKKNLTSDLLGFKVEPAKNFPLLLIINQTDLLNVKIELTTTDCYSAKIEQNGTAFFHYFGLVPKKPMTNLNVFREFFNSVLGNQIIQLQLSDGHTKLKPKLKSLLIPSFLAKTLMMPAEIKSHFDLLDLETKQLELYHPEDLVSSFDKINSSFDMYSELYPWHILGLLSHFKLQLNKGIDGFEGFEFNKPNGLNFNNPLISDALGNLKTYAIYPSNPDVYIDYKIKTHQELQLPLTSMQIKIEDEANLLVLKFEDKEIIHLHSSIIMNHFIKFILQNATGIKIADLLVNLKIPSVKDLDEATANVDKITSCKTQILKSTEDLISKLLRTQISN